MSSYRVESIFEETQGKKHEAETMEKHLSQGCSLSLAQIVYVYIPDLLQRNGNTVCWALTH